LLTKANEAAIAIGAKLAVPSFKDTGSKPTDFNDLAAAEGLGEVKRQIEAAAPPKESDDDIIARLAKLPFPSLEYEREREKAAKALGCRAGMLDRIVDKERPKSEATEGDELQGHTMSQPDTEPWPDPVDGAAVLAEVAETFRRYAVLPEGVPEALALWAAQTHCFDAFTCSPRLHITSPEKGCGKSTARDVLAVLVPRPLPAENLSVAVLFRVIEAHRPTILADETDTWLADSEALRGLLNAGHRRGGQALRCEGEGNEVRAFAVFAPAQASPSWGAYAPGEGALRRPHRAHAPNHGGGPAYRGRGDLPAWVLSAGPGEAGLASLAATWPRCRQPAGAKGAPTGLPVDTLPGKSLWPVSKRLCHWGRWAPIASPWAWPSNRASPTVPGASDNAGPMAASWGVLPTGEKAYQRLRPPHRTERARP